MRPGKLKLAGLPFPPLSGYDAVRRPRLDASAFAHALGYHVHVGLRGGKLARVGISEAPHEGDHDPAALALARRVADHCASGKDAFADVPLDLSDVSGFDARVLATLVREVLPGKVVTYGELARLCGASPSAARAIGGAMARNPMPIVVPCHRVVPAGSAVGNYSGEGGWETKMRLLRAEGARGVWGQRQLAG